MFLFTYSHTLWKLTMKSFPDTSQSESPLEQVYSQGCTYISTQFQLQMLPQLLDLSQLSPRKQKELLVNQDNYLLMKKAKGKGHCYWGEESVPRACNNKRLSYIHSTKPQMVKAQQLF